MAEIGKITLPNGITYDIKDATARANIASAVATETSRAQEAEANRYTKNETYTKEEVNNLITTPNQKYVSITATEQTTVVTDVLPATGAADTIYRVGNWDGSKYDVTKYSEYAWNGKDYVHLSTKTQIGDVFDISAYHATGGTLATYDNLEDALGTNGKNIPQSLRKGGMSVKFVQTSDNKYVQYRLTAQTFSTNEDDWTEGGGGDGVYDISIAHSDATYDNLAAALGTNGANIPSNKRSGGMSIRFQKNVYATYSVVKTEGLETEPTGTELESAPAINSGTYIASQLSAFSTLPSSIGSANAVTYYVEVSGESTTYTKWVITKMTNDSAVYVQWRYMGTSIANADFTNVANWQGVDDVPTSGSKNLVDSGGVFDYSCVANTPEMVTGCILKNDGRESIDTNWIKTSYVEVNEGEHIFTNLKDTNKQVRVISFFDSEQALISYVSGDHLNYYTVVPPGVKYVRFCGRSSDFGRYNPRIFLFFPVSELVKNLKNEISQLVFHDNMVFDDITGEAATNGYFIDINGVISANQDWAVSDYIEVRPWQMFLFKAKGSTDVSTVAIYDADKRLISNCVASSNNVYFSGCLKAPENAKYYRISKFANDSQQAFYISNSKLFDMTLDYYENSHKHVGFIGSNGEIANRTSTNWRFSDFIKCEVGDTIDYIIGGNPNISSVTIYDENFGVLYTLSGAGQLRGKKEITETGAAYVRFCIPYAPAYSQKTAIQVKFQFDKYVRDCSIVNQSDENYGNDIIYPYAVYDVCNDVPNTATNGCRNRNMSQAIYIDHLLTDITHEMDIHFKDAVDRIVFTAPMYVTDSSEATPATNFNNGKDVNEEDFNISIVGNDINKRDFVVKHRSTLNSVTSAAHPKVLCIGDSITYGEQATMPNDDYASNHVYHLNCKQLFMKDAIDNNGNGFDITFLGHYAKENSFTYKNVSYVCKTHHEGIRGIGIAAYLNGGVSAFKSDVTNKFSIDAWLGKYRTMDDTGNRLPWSSAGATVVGQDGNTYTIGTLIDSESTLNSIDVCLPTHILIMLGMNGGATVAQYQEMIGIIHNEHPEIFVAIGIPDSAGTYFPSLHPNCGDDCVIWNDNKHGQGSRHSQMFSVQKNLQEEFAKDSYEEDKVYILPFFFVTPTAEGVSNRVANLPDAGYNIVKNNDYLVNYGWYASTHMNAYGHMNWGYCLYSWLKYTLALEVN